MATMIVITNESGKIVAAMNATSGSNARLMPLAGQRMHQIEEVPVEVSGLANPVEFHKAITKHFHAKGSKVTPVDPLKVGQARKPAT
jgi:hypothetical protein